MSPEVLALAAALALIACVSAAETACFSLSRHELKRLATQSRPGATLARLLDDAPRLLGTILILATAGSVAATIAAAALFHHVFHLEGGALVVADAVVTSFALLVLGDITPKTLAVHHAEAIALASAEPLRAAQTLLAPLATVLAHLARALGAGGSAHGGHDEAGHDSLVDTIEAGRAEGILARGERDLLLGVLLAQNRVVAQAMKPWARVITVPGAWEPGRALARLVAAGVTRAPVLGAAGEVVGIVRAHDLLAAAQPGTGRTRPSTARELARPVFFVDPDTPLPTAFRMVRRDRTYVLVVGTDAARPHGLVTLRDLVEELHAASRALPVAPQSA